MLSKKQVIKLKVAVIGSPNAGKTSFIKRLIQQNVKSNEETTNEYEIYLHFLQTKTEYFEIQLWDCSSHHQQFHKYLRQAFFRNSSAAILIIDLSSQKWKDKAHSWISEAYENQCYLVHAIATKVDLISDDSIKKNGLEQNLNKKNKIEEIKNQAINLFNTYDIKVIFQSQKEDLKPDIQNLFLHIHEQYQIVSRNSMAKGLGLGPPNIIQTDFNTFTNSVGLMGKQSLSVIK